MALYVDYGGKIGGRARGFYTVQANLVFKTNIVVAIDCSRLKWDMHGLERVIVEAVQVVSSLAWQFWRLFVGFLLGVSNFRF